MFRAIASSDFPPFGEFSLEFPPVENKPADLGEVHLLTGVNGTGKTRLLALMAAFLGNPDPLRRRLKGIERRITFMATDILPQSRDPAGAAARNHQWTLAEGHGRNWNVLQHTSFYQKAENAPAFAYSGIAYLADAQIAVLANLTRPDRVSCLSFVRPPEQSQQLLQAITNLKLQCAMDSMDQAPPAATQGRAVRLVKALEKTLTEITGSPFVFQVATYPTVSLAVRWGPNTLAFDLLPDGLRSIIGWLVHAVAMMDVWLQGKGNAMDTEAIFLLDEIESHLHPAWQRKILPAFQRLFPKSQIFVATHSPFVIASLNHGWIHCLTLGKDGRAQVQKPIAASKGDSYVSVVEDIMGLKEWYDPETEDLLGKFRATRDAAYKGDNQAQTEARKLAAQIGQRSMELDYMMGRELSQMDRQLARFGAAK